MKPLVLRIFLRLFTRLAYRVTILGGDNVPSTGGALLVSNHLSYVDLILILASTDRFVRFLLPRETVEHWSLRPFVRYLGIIPLPPETQPGEHGQALAQARDLIRQGEVVGIFAERNISRLGVLLTFRH